MSRTILSLSIFSAMAFSCLAQETTATLLGVATDSSGAVLPNVTIRVTNLATKHVFYARTSNFSTMGIATGSAIASASFVVPASVETGTSALVVVANGIASKPVKVTIN